MKELNPNPPQQVVFKMVNTKIKIFKSTLNLQIKINQVLEHRLSPSESNGS